MLLAIASFFVGVSIWYFVAIGFIWFNIAFINSASISSNYHVKAYCSNPSTTQKVIALTFDDGPNELTPLFLDVLNRYKAKATFFCIGKNIEKYPEILRRTIKEGHTIGNHSYSHSPLFDFYRKDRLIEEFNMTDTLIEKATGKKTTLFRPPYGVTYPSIRRALSVTRHKVIGWNIRSLDTAIKEEDKIFNRIIKRLSPGSIVLLHDTSQRSANVLEQLLVHLEQNDYKVVPLDQLLNVEV